MSPWSRPARLAASSVGLLLALPVLLYRYPPMADLPMHEALVALMHHLDDPRWAPPGMYFVVAPQANQLFHLLAYVLAFVVPTDTACKLIVAAIVASSPLLMVRLLTSLHLSPWGAALVVPIVCGWMFGWGLVPNLLGFALLLFFLPAAETLARRGEWRDVLTATFAVCLLFFAHESTAVVFAIVVGYGVCVRAPRSVRAVARRAVPLLATLLLMALQWRLSRSLASATMVGIGSASGPDAYARLVDLPGAVFGGLGSTRLSWLGASALAASLAGAIASLRARRPRSRRLPPRVFLWRYRYAVLAVVFFVLFLTFPFALGGTTLLSHRFLPHACTFAIVACSPRVTAGRTIGRLFAALAMLVPVVTAFAHHSRFAQAHQSFVALDAILSHIPDGASVAQLELTPLPPGPFAPIPGAPSRAQAEHGGRMLFGFTDTPPNPVYMRPELRWSEPTLRLALQPFAFTPQHDGRRFAFLLVRSTNMAYRPFVTNALAPEHELVLSQGEWQLYRATSATVPIDSPDAPLPHPAPETLADRIRRDVTAH